MGYINVISLFKQYLKGYCKKMNESEAVVRSLDDLYNLRPEELREQLKYAEHDLFHPGDLPDEEFDGVESWSELDDPTKQYAIVIAEIYRRLIGHDRNTRNVSERIAKQKALVIKLEAVLAMAQTEQVKFDRATENKINNIKFRYTID